MGLATLRFCLFPLTSTTVRCSSNIIPAWTLCDIWTRWLRSWWRFLHWNAWIRSFGQVWVDHKIQSSTVINRWWPIQRLFGLACAFCSTTLGFMLFLGCGFDYFPTHFWIPLNLRYYFWIITNNLFEQMWNMSDKLGVAWSHRQYAWLL